MDYILSDFLQYLRWLFLQHVWHVDTISVQKAKKEGENREKATN